MNPDNTQSPRSSIWILAISFLVIVFCIYKVISGFLIANSTGLLHISSSVEDSIISISQENHKAVVVGKGRANIRLKPGLYSVVAYNDGKEASVAVQVDKKKTSQVKLDLAKSYILPSVQSISYSGTGELLDSGLSSSQIYNFKLDFFKYKPLAKTVAIKANSVQPGPRNPATDIGFKTNFLVTIDSQEYKATITYSDLNNIRLYLYNSQTSALVFDSGMTQ